MIYVCALDDLAVVAASLRAFRLLTLLSPSHADDRWKRHACGPHLYLAFHDIAEHRAGLLAPDRDIVLAIIDFGRDATDEMPLLIHCWAGISRSSAAAYIVACARNPGYEHDLAQELRRRAPFATPNALMVSLADDCLARDGRMLAATRAIGRGADACTGKPYVMPLTWPPI